MGLIYTACHQPEGLVRSKIKRKYMKNNVYIFKPYLNFYQKTPKLFPLYVLADTGNTGKATVVFSLLIITAGFAQLLSKIFLCFDNSCFGDVKKLGFDIFTELHEAAIRFDCQWI